MNIFLSGVISKIRHLNDACIFYTQTIRELSGIDVVLGLNSSKIQRGNDKEKAHFVFSMLVDYLFRSSHMGHKSKESR